MKPPASPTANASSKLKRPARANTPAKSSVRSPSIIVPKKTAHNPYLWRSSNIEAARNVETGLNQTPEPATQRGVSGLIVRLVAYPPAFVLGLWIVAQLAKIDIPFRRCYPRTNPY